MSCVLRASFPTSKRLTSFVENTSLPSFKDFKKGDKLFPNSKKKSTLIKNTGINIYVASFKDDFFQFGKQVRIAYKFLNDHKTEVRRLVKLASKDSVLLDFGVGTKKNIPEFFRIPKKLVKMCGELSLDIEISRYPCSEDD